MIDLGKPYAAHLADRAARLETLAVHAGEAGRHGPLDTPIVLSSAFGFASAEEAAGAFRGENDAYIYGRWANPTVEALEAKLAALEGARACAATASGMAAVSGAVLSVCENGSHIVAPRAMYAESARLFRERLPRFGVTTTFVDALEPGAYEAAITPATRLLYIETPSNPILGVTDIGGVVALARARGLVTIADNTFATPFAQRPHADHGVDLVVHSMTKALGGHGDAIGGAICGGAERVRVARDLVVKGFGGVLSPLTAWLVARGLATFALRQRQACETAAILAARLTKHPKVARVHHPSLPSHPGHALAAKQMHAFGSLLAFELATSGGAADRVVTTGGAADRVVTSGGAADRPLEAGRRTLEGVRVVTHAVSLGDVRSLMTHPASTTHSTMPKADRERAGITDGLLRLSVGIEASGDLWSDLEAAIDASC